MVVPELQTRRAKMNHDVISGELFRQCGPRRRPEVLRGAGPVRETIEGPAITEDNRRIVNVRCDFELALNEEDRALGGTLAIEIVLAWKPATKHNAGSFR